MKVRKIFILLSLTPLIISSSLPVYAIETPEEMSMNSSESPMSEIESPSSESYESNLGSFSSVNDISADNSSSSTSESIQSESEIQSESQMESADTSIESLEESINSLDQTEESQSSQDSSSELSIENESESSQEVISDEEESAIEDSIQESESEEVSESLEKSVQRPSLRNAVLLSAPVDPIADGWSTTNVSVRSTVILNDRYEMRFLFGPNNRVGSRPSGGSSGAIPNFYLYDRSTGKINGTLWPSENVSSTSHGTIVAELDSPTSSSTSFNRYANVEPSSVTMYTKNVNNSQAIKIRFTENTPNTRTPILYEIELYPLVNGNVRVTHRAFNTSSSTLNNMVFGSIYDAFLGTDTVPVRYIGNNKGLYTQSNDLHLDYLFVGASKNNTAIGLNWAAGDLGFARLTNVFPNFSSPGRENSNDPAGSFALQNRDSAIYMKTMPTTFAPGDSIAYTYDVGVAAISNVPEISVSKTEDAYTSTTENLVFEGTWRDYSGTSDELFYQIDGKAAVKIGDTLTNSEPGLSRAWKVTIPASQFDRSTKNIKFFVRNNSGNQSTNASVKVTYQTQSTISQEILDPNNLAVTELSRSSSYNVRVNYKTTADLVGKTIGSLTLSSVLTGPVGSVSNITLVNQNGTVLGTGSYNESTKTVTASLANGTTFSSNDTVSLRYTLVTAAQAAAGATIQFVGKSNVTTTTTSETIAAATNTMERPFRAEPPTLTLNQDDVEYQSSVQNLTFNGTWTDPIGTSVTLYIKLITVHPLLIELG